MHFSQAWENSSVEQSKATQSFMAPATHTTHYSHGREVAPIPTQTPHRAPQTTSLPGHAHRKSGVLCTKCLPLIPTRNIPVLCQPCAGSPRAHLSAAV